MKLITNSKSLIFGGVIIAFFIFGVHEMGAYSQAQVVGDKTVIEKGVKTGSTSAIKKDLSEIQLKDINKVGIYLIDYENRNEKKSTESSKLVTEIIKQNNNNQQIFEMKLKSREKVFITQSSESSIKITKNGISATANLPILINFTRNELMMKTSIGNIMLQSYPDEILTKFIKSGHISTKSNVKLEIKYEPKNLIYTINEVDKVKFLNLFPVELIKNIKINDKTSKIISIEESLITKILRLYSL